MVDTTKDSVVGWYDHIGHLHVGRVRMADARHAIVEDTSHETHLLRVSALVSVGATEELRVRSGGHPGSDLVEILAEPVQGSGLDVRSKVEQAPIVVPAGSPPDLGGAGPSGPVVP
jgi:hypothetical protein